MKHFFVTLFTLHISFCAFAQQNEIVIEETNGQIVVEAEHFIHQENDSIRKWYLVSKDHQPKIEPDGDEFHFESASNQVYLEILPDTRRTHDDPLIRGENFTNEPGETAVLSYQVYINTPGKYYVWVRAYSTSTEDNSLHVGINGMWPDSGRRMQWCEGKNTWRWESKQRTEEVHCGVPYMIYLDVNEPGLNTIMFSMREDGFEFDQWMMTLERDTVPENKSLPESPRLK